MPLEINAGMHSRPQPSASAPPQPAGSAPPQPSDARPALVAVLASVQKIARDRSKQLIGERFRMPGTADPGVPLRRLAGVSTWAAVLGFGGLVAAIRIVIRLFTSAPQWYLSTMCAIGLFGLACTVGGFASIHRRATPWILLTLATLTLTLAALYDISR